MSSSSSYYVQLRSESTIPPGSAGSSELEGREWVILGFHGDWIAEPPVDHSVRFEKIRPAQKPRRLGKIPSDRRRARSRSSS